MINNILPNEENVSTIGGLFIVEVESSIGSGFIVNEGCFKDIEFTPELAADLLLTVYRGLRKESNLDAKTLKRADRKVRSLIIKNWQEGCSDSSIMVDGEDYLNL